MIIHRLSFAAIGPFASQYAIDFDGLGGSALFLIDGPTGAGKSTIIDALVFALFGEVAGGTSTQKQRLRSSFADSRTESFCELEFSTSAGRFKVRRTPEYERAKQRGTGLTPVSESVQLWRSTGSEGWEIVETRVGAADSEIARLVGLNRAQFLQTVVLPQGAFATFLRADSADRLAVLQRIFATDVFTRLELALDDARRIAVSEREGAVAAVRRAAEHAVSRLSDSDHARPDLGDLDLDGAGGEAVSVELAGIVHEVDRRLLEQSTAVATCAERAAAARGRVTEIEARAAARDRVSAARDLLGRASARKDAAVARLGGHAPVIESIGGDAEDPAALEALVSRMTGSLEAAVQAEQNVPRDEAEVGTLGGLLAAVQVEIEALEQERDHELPGRLMALALALEGAVKAATAVTAEADMLQSALVRERLEGMAAELAGGLRDGEPCPVCGAATHPTPAVSSGDPVTDDDLAEASRRHIAARARQQELDVQRATVTGMARTVAATPDPAVSAATVPVARIADEIEGLRHRQTALDSALASARERRTDATARIASAESVLAERRATVAGAVAGYGTVAERVKALTALRAAVAEATAAAEVVRAHEHSLVAAESELESLVRSAAGADGAVDEDLALLRAERDRWADELQAAVSVRDATNVLVTDLRLRVQAVDAAVAERDACLARTADVIALASVVKGGAGNSLAQPLSAYVVQTMFDEILESANRRLRGMLDGRFELRSTEQRTSRRMLGQGLGLEVLDLRTETFRNPSTLSGGETFCASLALALGLADTVRAHAGGVEIGMLLIDEGFGSLDGERLDEVMAELLRLRADGRTVGVISHVTEMKRSILERIDVRPLGAREESTLSVSWST